MQCGYLKPYIFCTVSGAHHKSTKRNNEYSLRIYVLPDGHKLLRTMSAIKSTEPDRVCVRVCAFAPVPAYVCASVRGCYAANTFVIKVSGAKSVRYHWIGWPCLCVDLVHTRTERSEPYSLRAMQPKGALRILHIERNEMAIRNRGRNASPRS